MAKGEEYVYKVVGEGEFSSLTSETAKLNKFLKDSRGNLEQFKALIEKDSKGTTEYKLVIRSEFNDSGTRVAKASVVELNKEYEGLYRKIRQIEKEPQNGSLTRLRQQVNEAKRARDATQKYASSFDGIGRRITTINQSWVAQNQKVADLKRQLDIVEASNVWEKFKADFGLKGIGTAGRQLIEIVNVFQSLAIIIGQINGAINSFVSALGNLQSFELAFKAIGVGASGGAQALLESSRIASNLGVDLNTVRQGFQQLSPVVLNTGGSINDVSKVMEALSSRFAAFGINGDRARRVMNGIIQAFSKGKLMAEELTQQISEADPAFKTDLAKALKVTVKELEAMVKAGEVTGEVLLANLPKLSKSALLYGKLGQSALDAADQLRQGNVTIDQVKFKIATLNQLSLEKFAKIFEPLFFTFIQIGASITDFVKQLSELEVIRTLSSLISAVAAQGTVLVDAFLNATSGVLRFLGAISSIISPFLEIPLVAQTVAAVITGKLILALGGLKTKFLEATVEARGFSGVLRGLLLGTDAWVNGLQRSIGSIKGGFVEFLKATRDVAQGRPGSGQAFRDIIAGSTEARRAVRETTQDIDRYTKAIEKNERRTKRLEKVQSKLKEELDKIDARRASQLTLPPSVDQRYEKLQRVLGAVNDALVTTAGAQDELKQKIEGANKAKQKAIAGMTRLDRAGIKLKDGLKGLVSGFRGLIAAIGPLGVIMAAIGLATKAFNHVNEESNAIMEEGAARANVLKKAVEDLGGGSSKGKQGATELQTAWDRFGLIIDTIVQSIVKGLNAIQSFVNEVVKSLDMLGNRFVTVTALAVGFGALGFALGGPWVGAIAAIIAGFIGASAGANRAGVDAELAAKKYRALAESARESAFQAAELGKAIEKIPDSELSKGSSANRTKAIGAYQALTSEVERLGDTLDQTKAKTGLLQNDLNFATDKLEKRKKELKDLRAEEEEYVKILTQRRENKKTTEEMREIKNLLKENRQRQREVTGEIGLTENAQEALGKEYGEAAESLERQEAALKRVKEEAEKLGKKLNFANPNDDFISSLKEMQDKMAQLKTIADNVDLMNPKGIEDLRQALASMEALKYAAEELGKTKVQIQVELINLQQQIAESELKINLDPGPLRDAAILVSKISNKFKQAQISYSEELRKIQYLSKTSNLDEKEKKRLIESAALKFVAASKEARAEIVEAGREFEKQLKQARREYQGLLLDKPEFFTPGEIRQNAKQIERDFEAALNKVRADTGDWTWGPKLTGKTYDEILKQKKEFIEAREKADDLKSSIKQLSTVLQNLTLVLARLANIDLKELSKLKSKDFLGKNAPSMEKMTETATQAQAAITGMNYEMKDTEKKYGEIVGTVKEGSKQFVYAFNLATGALEQIPEAEYKAANATAKMSKEAVNGAEEMKKGFTETRKSADDIVKPFKEVIGQITAGAQTVYLVQDTFTGKIEEMSGAMLKAAGISNTLSKSYAALTSSIRTAADATDQYLKRQEEQKRFAGPTAIKIGQNIGMDPTTTRQVMDAGAEAGGDFMRAMSITVGRDQMFATGVLNQMANATQDYRSSIQMLNMVTEEARQAQFAYNQALRTGQGDLIMLGAAVENANAKLDAAKYAAENASRAYIDTAKSAEQLGIDMNSVVEPGTILQDPGPRTLQESYEQLRQQIIDANDASKEFGKGGLGEANQQSFELGTNVGGATIALNNGQAPAVSIAGSLGEGASAAERLASAINGLRDADIDIRIKGGPVPRWSGGPVIAGQTYKVNELGREGFLSKSGSLSPIRKPQNGLWRPHASGTVIPAHVMKQLDVPRAGVSVHGGKISSISRSTKTASGISRLVREIRMATSVSGSGLQREIATTHASQTMEIGKLTRAVRDLVDKDWNVNVKLRNNGGTTYLDALNRMS